MRTLSEVESRRANELEAEKAALQAELEELRARQNAARRARGRRVRRITAGVLVVLTSVSVVAGTVGVWTRRTAFDTERYVALVSDLAQEPEVQAVLADYLTGQTYEALDVEARVMAALAASEALAERADVLAPAISAGARRLIHGLVTRFLDTNVFQDLWPRLVSVGHQKVVALLRGNYEQLPNVVIEEGEVRLNLIPVLAQVIRRLVEAGVGLVAPDVTIPSISAGESPEVARARLSAALGNPLPEDFGQVTILSEQRLSELQDAVRTFDRLVWGLVGLVVILIAVTLLVSVSRRRTLLQLAIGVVAALFLAGIAIRRIRDVLLAGITGGDAREAAREVFAATIGDLRSLGLLVLWTALAVAIVAYLAGRPPWVARVVVRARTTDTGGFGGWAADHADGLRVAILAAGALVLFLTGIGWVSVIVVGVVVAGAFWALSQLGTAPGREVESPKGAR